MVDLNGEAIYFDVTDVQTAISRAYSDHRR